jgi:hypothetical protein
LPDGATVLDLFHYGPAVEPVLSPYPVSTLLWSVNPVDGDRPQRRPMAVETNPVVFCRSSSSPSFRATPAGVEH